MRRALTEHPCRPPHQENWEIDPRKSKVRRLVAQGVKMMRGDYRLLLHYPIKADGH